MFDAGQPGFEMSEPPKWTEPSDSIVYGNGVTHTYVYIYIYTQSEGCAPHFLSSWTSSFFEDQLSGKQTVWTCLAHASK